MDPLLEHCLYHLAGNIAAHAIVQAASGEDDLRTVAKREYDLDLVDEPKPGNYDGIIIAVAHEIFQLAGSSKARLLGKETHVLYDIKHIFPKSDSDIRL